MMFRKILDMSYLVTPVRQKVTDRDFWAAFILSFPFYADYVSWWLLLPPILIFFTISCKDLSFDYDKLIYVFPLVFFVFFHLFALSFSTTPFAYQVIKDCLICSILIFAFVFTKRNIIDYFFSFIMPLAVTTAVLGLGKVYLLEVGYLFGPLLENCASYPMGTSLCVNYNNVGMLWLLAGIACVRKNSWIILSVLMVAGILSGSRRFLLLLPLVPLAWIFVSGWSQNLKFVLCILTSMLLYSGIVSPTITEQPHTDKRQFKVLFSEKNDVEIAKKNERFYPNVVLETVVDGTYGISSRTDFWKYGFSMVGWLPQGWKYHALFSCKFSNCTDFHYPHSPIISEWLIGGVLGALASFLFYFVSIYRSYIANSRLNLVLLFAVLPYSFISGDTILSLPTCISVMMVSSMGGLLSNKQPQVS